MNAFLTSSATDEPTPTTNSRRIPTIIKLQRKNGRVVQGCDVYIGRRCVMGGWNLPQSKWANKNTVRECGSAEMAVKLYREDILNSPDLILDLIELEGKTLGCWYVKILSVSIRNIHAKQSNLQVYLILL